jgi:DNA repair protein RadC
MAKRCTENEKGQSKSSNLCGHRGRLRLRFSLYEFEGFSDHEIIELVLTFCIPRKDVKPLAKNMLQAFGSIRGIFDADPSELEKFSGVGSATSIVFKVIRAMNSLYLQKSCEMNVRLNSPGCTFALWQNRLSGLKNEVVEVAYLDADLRLLKDGIVRMGCGTVTAVPVLTRSIAESALLRKASAVIIAHNHPSGSPEPSEGDEHSTTAIKNVLEVLGIPLVDHLIIAKNGYFSFRENCLL